MDIIEKLRDIHSVGRIEDCSHSTQVCADAADEIDRLRAEREWRPIETAAPKIGLPRLYRINGFCVQGFVDATGALMVQSEIAPHWRMARGKPTHWMPLPAAPKQEEE